MAQIQTAAQEKMEQKLLDENILEQADRFAKVAVFETYQPLLSKMVWGYTLEVEFID